MPDKQTSKLAIAFATVFIACVAAILVALTIKLILVII